MTQAHTLRYDYVKHFPRSYGLVAVCFGEFVFDPGARTLLRRGRRVHLTPRAFKLLETLVANRPKPVHRSELTRQLWPETFVSEGNLRNVVLEVRRALDDEHRLQLITTVFAFGYAFIGKAREEAAASTPRELGTFRVLVNGREIGLTEGETWIGRSLDCRVQVHCSLASRRHARIVIAGDDATLEDGGSRNGTLLRHERIRGPVALTNGDEITVGSVHLFFQVIRPDDPTDGGD